MAHLSYVVPHCSHLPSDLRNNSATPTPPCPSSLPVVEYGKKGCVFVEYLSKPARKVLKVFRSSSPKFQGGRFYLIADMQFPQNMDFNEVEACLNRLEEAHLIVPADRQRTVYKLTDQGRHWPEYSGQERRETFLKSILCPIVVTLITELALHGMPVLWRLIQALVEYTP